MLPIALFIALGDYIACALEARFIVFKTKLITLKTLQLIDEGQEPEIIQKLIDRI